MALRAGFAQTDITPPLGTQIIGWLRVIHGERVADPLFARAAVFECNGQAVGFVQLDTLSIRWTTAAEIRRRIEATHGFPGDRVMVSATHTHAGPAVAMAGLARRDEAYLATLVDQVVEVFGQALGARQAAEVGLGSCFEFNVAHNRRVVMRDGTAKTHGGFPDPDSLFIEGPIDPELAVIAARKPSGELLGALVNFACHPTHHGSDAVYSAGWPGALANAMGQHGCPVAMFLNGAAGNLHYGNRLGPTPSMEEIGQRLADDAAAVIEGLTWRTELELGSSQATVQLPYRNPSPEEIAGTLRGAQRFVDPTIYDRQIPLVLERIKTRGVQPAEVQVQRLGDWALVSIPAEYFVELGLRIKEETYPRHTLVVGYANGMVGYVPHREAFKRGGYETTFTDSSRLAPEAGDLLADTAVRLIRG